jgi:hypothetical protein
MWRRLDSTQVPDAGRLEDSTMGLREIRCLRAGFDFCITGSSQPAVSDGYWIVPTPRSAGSHTFHFRAREVFANGTSFQTEVTCHVTLMP